MSALDEAVRSLLVLVDGADDSAAVGALRDLPYADLLKFRERLNAALATLALPSEPEKRFPIQSERGAAPHPTTIPWWLADEAYSVYSAKYGRQQSLERLAERGGFGPSEMDTLRPGWREAARASGDCCRRAAEAMRERCATALEEKAHAATNRWLRADADASTDTESAIRLHVVAKTWGEATEIIAALPVTEETK